MYKFWPCTQSLHTDSLILCIFIPPACKKIRDQLSHVGVWSLALFSPPKRSERDQQGVYSLPHRISIMLFSLSSAFCFLIFSSSSSPLCCSSGDSVACCVWKQEVFSQVLPPAPSTRSPKCELVSTTMELRTEDAKKFTLNRVQRICLPSVFSFSLFNYP